MLDHSCSVKAKSCCLSSRTGHLLLAYHKGSCNTYGSLFAGNQSLYISNRDRLLVCSAPREHVCIMRHHTERWTTAWGDRWQEDCEKNCAMSICRHCFASELLLACTRCYRTGLLAKKISRQTLLAKVACISSPSVTKSPTFDWPPLIGCESRPHG